MLFLVGILLWGKVGMMLMTTNNSGPKFSRHFDYLLFSTRKQYLSNSKQGSELHIQCQYSTCYVSNVIKVSSRFTIL